MVPLNEANWLNPFNYPQNSPLEGMLGYLLDETGFSEEEKTRRGKMWSPAVGVPTNDLRGMDGVTAQSAVRTQLGG